MAGSPLRLVEFQLPVITAAQRHQCLVVACSATEAMLCRSSTSILLGPTLTVINSQPPAIHRRDFRQFASLLRHELHDAVYRLGAFAEAQSSSHMARS